MSDRIEEARAKLYQFVSDPANQGDPDMDRARRLLDSLPKSAPSRGTPGPNMRPQHDTEPSPPIQTRPYHFKMQPGGVEYAPPEQGGPPEEAFSLGHSKYRLPSEIKFDRQGGINSKNAYVLDAFEHDPIAQTAMTGPLGYAVRGSTTAALGNAVPALVARVGGGMAEGLATSQVSGGDPTTGVAIGGALPLTSAALRLLGKSVLNTRAGQTAVNARAALESSGEWMHKPVQTFGVPSDTVVDALESGGDQKAISAARDALTFKAGHGLHDTGTVGAALAAAHYMHLPLPLAMLGLLPAAARNATPMIGRVGIPVGRGGSALVNSPLVQAAAQAAAARNWEDQ